jgi:hypothetical protein
MNRQELDDRLVDYLFDELSEEEASRFEAAVTGYPELQAEVVAHQQTRHLVAALPQREMSAQVMSAVMNEARAAVATAEEKPSWLESFLATLMQPAMVTAMLVLVVGGASVFVVQQGGDSEPGMSVASSIASPGVSHSEPSKIAEEMASVESPPLKVAALNLGEAAETTTSTAKGAGLASAEKPSAEMPFRPVSPAVSRLVEVDAEVGEVASATRIGSKGTRSKAKGARRSRAKRAVADSVQVARAEPMQKRAPIASPKVARRSRGNAPPMPAPPATSSAAPSARMQLSQSGQAADDGAEAEAAPRPKIAQQKERKQATSYASGADERKAFAAKKKGDSRAHGKRLVTEFERHLKKGDSAKAAKALDQLEKIPGFESAAKRKRTELRSWMKERARTKKRKSD